MSGGAARYTSAQGQALEFGRSTRLLVSPSEPSAMKFSPVTRYQCTWSGGGVLAWANLGSKTDENKHGIELAKEDTAELETDGCDPAQKILRV